jgi:hypothetical protein
MKPHKFKLKSISRRQIIPILTYGLIAPVFGFSNLQKEIPKQSSEEDYQTLLKPDGTIVKVKTSTIKKAKIVKKQVSNNSFLHWLAKK